MGAAAIPYLRFVEVNLQIPGIKSYNEDMLLLVIPTMTYSKTILVMVGTKIIVKALSLMTMGELAKATMTWRQGHFGVVMSPFNKVSLWRCRSSNSMTSKVQFAPHRKSPYPHLAPSIYGQTPMSRDTVCEYTFSLNWHLVPSCWQQWYPQLPMGNYTLVPQGYQSVCTI